jgi:hypothetical protein
MNLVSRDWVCLNRSCQHAFHSFERESPECPRCGCARVSWIPGGGHIGKTGNIDRTVRSLADSYGMTDVNTPSPSRLNRAMPKVHHHPADGPVVNFGGFRAPVNSQGFSTSGWAQGVTAKQTVQTGQAMARAKSYPQIDRSGLGLPGNHHPKGYDSPQRPANPIARPER